MFERMAILGPGLLGASLLIAARRRGLCASVQAWSRSAATRQQCARLPECDAVCETPEQATAGADLVVVCTPVETIAPLVASLAPRLAPGTLVTDVGSTKSRICLQAAAALKDTGAFFVGSHPMAGSEKSGIAHADPLLFEKRTCFVTPGTGKAGEVEARLVAFWAALGMSVQVTTPERHDATVAHVSHLPHLLASTLCAMLADLDPDWKQGAGQGLRDTTRIAAGDPELWREIFTENRQQVLQAVRSFQDALSRATEALDRNDIPALLQTLTRGKSFRDSL